MPIELTAPELTELHPRITVMGVGGAGGNAVNNMVRAELAGVSFAVANTDAQSLANSLTESRIQLGVQCTQGLGAGSKPEIGEQAAREALDEIEQHLDGCHMLFLTAGMGGGTGTGAAPIIAGAARERGILTVGVVTRPFQFEGSRRMAIAEAGIEELQRNVDTLIIIPNQNLFRIATEKTTFQDAFAMADEVLSSGVRGITDLMVMPGLINLDFADVKTVMSEMGKAMMGTGEADGEKRAIEAAEAAISNPLLDEVSLKGAKGVIINITGGMDLTLFEVDEAANHIRSQVDEDANIIVGSAFNESLNGQMRVSVVATGIEAQASSKPTAKPVRETASSASVVQLADHARAGEAPMSAAQAVEENTPPSEADSVIASADKCAVEATAEEEPDDEEAVMSAPCETSDEDEAEWAAKRDALAAVHDEDGFVAPPPKMPSSTVSAAGKPDPFAEAAFENGASPRNEPSSDAQVDSPVSARGKSLFQRMTSLGARGDGARKDESARTGDSREAETQEQAPSRRGFGRLSPEDRPVPKGAGEEQLEIPAFLRRQVH